MCKFVAEKTTKDHQADDPATFRNDFYQKMIADSQNKSESPPLKLRGHTLTFNLLNFASLSNRKVDSPLAVHMNV